MATYIVQPGDSLSAIAAANGTSLAEVIRLNPQIANPDLIHPGDEVTISEDAVVTAAIEEAPAAEAATEAVVEAAAEAPAEAPAAIPEALASAVEEAAAPAAPAEAAAPVAAAAQAIEGRLAE